jgi:hypothetical protein
VAAGAAGGDDAAGPACAWGDEPAEAAGGHSAAATVCGWAVVGEDEEADAVDGPLGVVGESDRSAPPVGASAGRDGPGANGWGDAMKNAEGRGSCPPGCGHAPRFPSCGALGLAAAG